jgi:hypothetical protein
MFHELARQIARVTIFFGYWLPDRSRLVIEAGNTNALGARFEFRSCFGDASISHPFFA